MIFLVFDSIYAPILTPCLRTQVEGIVLTTHFATGSRQLGSKLGISRWRYRLPCFPSLLPRSTLHGDAQNDLAEIGPSSLSIRTHGDWTPLSRSERINDHGWLAGTGPIRVQRSVGRSIDGAFRNLFHHRTGIMPVR